MSARESIKAIFWFKPTGYALSKRTTINNTRPGDKVARRVSEKDDLLGLGAHPTSQLMSIREYNHCAPLLWISGILFCQRRLHMPDAKVSSQVKTPPLFQIRSSQSPFAASMSYPGQLR